MRAWLTVYAQFRSPSFPEHSADNVLAEFDKRFPAPAAVDPASIPFVPADALNAVSGHELATLRQKARLWDAVGSGRIELRRTVSGIKPPKWWAFYGPCDRKTKLTESAAEAVEAAIAAGALK